MAIFHDKKNNGAKNNKLLREKRKMPWKGPEEIEELCGMFTTFLTAPAAVTADKMDEVQLLPEQTY